MTRTLPGAFTDPWEEWLKESLHQARMRLDEDWSVVFATSPLWCFLLSPRVVSPNPWAGVMIPSVDRVGRHFPLTVAADVSSVWRRGEVIAQLAPWFAQARRVSLSALEPPYDFDALVQEVRALDELLGEPETHPHARGGFDRRPPRGFRLPWKPPEDSPKPDVPTSLDFESFRQLLGGVVDNHTVWWTEGSELVDPSVVVSAGLPKAESARALLTGEWETLDWLDTGPSASP